MTPDQIIALLMVIADLRMVVAQQQATIADLQEQIAALTPKDVAPVDPADDVTDA